MAVPFISIPDKPIEATTQNNLPVADVADNLVIFKDGGVSLVMETTSLNFGLLSEMEQQAVIASYAGLLNSLNFHIQIVIRSQRKDIQKYIIVLDQRQNEITNPKLSHLMSGYKRFIVEAIKKKNVLSKRFFVVIPYSPLEMGVKKGFAFANPFKNKAELFPFPKNYVIKKAKIALFPKRDHLIRQANRLGVRMHQLTTDELVDVLHSSYNAQPPIKDKSLFK